MIHVPTLEDYGGLTNPPASWNQIAPWATWAITTGAQSWNAQGVGVKTILYTNPNRQGPGDPMYTSDETTFAHDCSGNRITITQRPWQDLMDPHSTHLVSLWQQAYSQASGAFNAVFEDNAVQVSGDVSALPCNFSQTDWENATNNLQDNSGLSIVWNSNLSRVNGVAGPAYGLTLNPTAIGGSNEGCYSSADATTIKPRSYYWKALENTELAMIAQQKPWLCRGNNTTAAATVQDWRIYMTASYLLTYDPAYTIYSEKFATFSGFEVEPEAELVPKDPLVPEPSDVSALQVSNNVYAREYAHCFLKGNYVGPCAVVVNIDAANFTHPFPYPGKYNHTLVLSGGGVLDGGTVSAYGPAPASTIQGNDAVIAIK